MNPAPPVMRIRLDMRGELCDLRAETGIEPAPVRDAESRVGRTDGCERLARAGMLRRLPEEAVQRTGDLIHAGSK